MGGVVSFVTTPFHTKRETTVRVHNQFEEELDWIIVKHKYGNDIQHKTWRDVRVDEYTSDDLTVRYKTGPGSRFDVWYVKWCTGGDLYEQHYYINPYWNNGWKQCYLTRKDSWGSVTIRIKISF